MRSLYCDDRSAVDCLRYLVMLDKSFHFDFLFCSCLPSVDLVDAAVIEVRGELMEGITPER